MFLKNKYIYGFLITVVLGLTACSDSADFDNDGIRSGSGADNEVSFLLSLPTGQSTQTRGDSPALPNTISNGSKIDKLIFSIYEVPYKDGEEDLDNAEIVSLTSSEDKDQQTFNDLTPESWPINIKLSLDPSKGYRVVFWAQNSACDAYDTEDLKEIKVKYEHTVDDETVNYYNNDESRDAFCGMAILTPDDVESSKNVILHRPFAQINIGTTGADYANLIYNPNVKPNYMTITQSKITVEGVANRYNALKGIAYAKNEDDIVPEKPVKVTAEYDWENLPAWINSGTPEFPLDGTYWSSKEVNPFVKIDNTSSEFNGPEEFLYVKLNGDKGLPKGYITDYPTVVRETEKDENGNEVKDEFGNPVYKKTIKEYKTETFKYLSMCYILVPTSETMIPVKDSENKDTKVSGSLVNITYNLRQYKPDETDHITLEEKTITNVPVSANWRTNILGGLYDSDNDPTSIFNTTPITATIVTSFDTEYFVGNVEMGTTSDDDDQSGDDKGNEKTTTRKIRN